MVFQSVQLTVQPDAITLEHTNVIVATMDMPSQQMDRVTVCSVEFHLISVGLTIYHHIYIFLWLKRICFYSAVQFTERNLFQLRRMLVACAHLCIATFCKVLRVMIFVLLSECSSFCAAGCNITGVYKCDHCDPGYGPTANGSCDSMLLNTLEL